MNRNPAQRNEYLKGMKGMKEGRVGGRRLLPEGFKGEKDGGFRKMFEMPN
jgi:hypothetical protein